MWLGIIALADKIFGIGEKIASLLVNILHRNAKTLPYAKPFEDKNNIDIKIHDMLVL